MLKLIAITQKKRTSFAMMLITASNFEKDVILSPKCEFLNNYLNTCYPKRILQM